MISEVVFDDTSHIPKKHILCDSLYDDPHLFAYLEDLVSLLSVTVESSCHHYDFGSFAQLLELHHHLLIIEWRAVNDEKPYRT